MQNKKYCNVQCNNMENDFNSGMFAGSAGKDVHRPGLLLHSCCGPCSTAVIERILEDYDITIFFYNPCITDKDEYEKRKETQIKFIEMLNQRLGVEHSRVNFIEGNYDVDLYFRRVSGLEGEPEGGRRCTACFRQRLNMTAKYGKEHGFEIFGTTLTVSPHKNYKLITEIGMEFADKYGISFMDKDFKKKAGFQRSVQLSREYELYRQDYCGCLFSRRD
ncbi:MAG: epoxyqueuosine reductase QueH [Hornefia sp.]|nr:epoxyqueuosine reductase QueH [Hornefia sp.]